MPDMPQWSDKPRNRREAAAPRIELPLWTRVLARRVEGQLGRDWTFGGGGGVCIFRSTSNMSRTMCSYEGRNNDSGSSMTA